MLRNRFGTSFVGLRWGAVALLAACGSGSDGPSPGPNPPGLTAARATPSGDQQTAEVGQPLDQPISIIVTRGGNPEAGAAVTWTAAGTGASVAPQTGVTDASGIASTVWILGQALGNQTAQGAVAGATGSPVSFSATAIASGGGPASATVTLREAGGNRFDPSAVTIGVGGTVTWVWGDGTHNVTSTGSPSFTSSGSANPPPRSYPITFNAARRVRL